MGEEGLPQCHAYWKSALSWNILVRIQCTVAKCVQIDILITYKLRIIRHVFIEKFQKLFPKVFIFIKKLSIYLKMPMLYYLM